MQDHYREMYLLRAGWPVFKRRVDEAKRILEEALQATDGWYCSWSGGKDSLCLLILLSQMSRTDIPVFTQADDLDWPDKEEFCRGVVDRLGFVDYSYEWSEVSAVAQLADGSETVRGTFSHVINRYVQAQKRTGVIMGLRAEESKGRVASRRFRGAIYQVKDGSWRCNPLADWRGEDVFALILSTDTPYMHVYDKDDEKPPHEIRFSWMLAPNCMTSGDAAFLKRHYPDLYNRFAARHPEARRYV